MRTYCSPPNLTYRYMIALGLIALLSIAAYFSLYQVIETQERSASLINISGRQRMLSQRIKLFYLLLISMDDQWKRESTRQKLIQAITLMEKSHNALINGDKGMGLAGQLSPKIRSIYFSPPTHLDKQVRFFLSAARSLAHSSDQELSTDYPDVASIFSSKSDLLLTSLDAVVNSYQIESEEKINRLQQMEKIVLGLTLFTLFVEALLIFRPMVRRIGEETAKLIESEKRLAAVLNTVGEGIITMDSDKKILSINREVINIWGFSMEELLGKNIEFLMPETYREFQLCTIDRHIFTGILEERFELKGRKKEGALFPFEISLNRVVIEQEVFFTVALRDITKRKESEEKIKNYAEELKLSNDDLKNFAYIVSHDLRTPLVNLKGFSTELDLSLQDIDDVVGKYLHHFSDRDRESFSSIFKKDVAESRGFINSSVDRMDGLINAILRLSRLGHRELTPEPIDMEELTRAVLHSMAHQIDRSGARVTISPLPQIMADRVSMEQIMGNILINAVNYLVPERTGNIEISADSGEHMTTVHIDDNGRGISEEEMHKVFEIFRRAGKQDVPGEGMGLAYVQTLVRRHGGRIWCRSRLGKGTTFAFSIPKKGDTV